MAKPRILNQRKANLEHKKRVEQYAVLIQQVFDKVAKEAARYAELAGAGDDKPFSFSDYPLAKRAFDKLQNELISKVSAVIMRGTAEEWKESNLIQDLVARKVLTAYTGTNKFGEEYTRYFQTNPDALKAFQQRKDEGMNLSTRVWNISEQYKTELEESISAAIAPGMPAMELAAEVKKYLKEPDKRFRRVRDKFGNLQLSKNAKDYHPGRGVYRSSARNAQRLARTEINMAYRTAEQKRWKQFDFVVGYEVKTTQNGHHVTDICDQLAGKYPKDFVFKGWHPQCMCYTIPILKTEEEFWADDSEDSTKNVNEVSDVPDNFKEWVRDNEGRIEKAEQRGTLPYFIKDNRGLLDEARKENDARSPSESTPTRLLYDDNLDDKYVGEGLISRLQGFPISKEYLYLSTHEKVAEKLRQALLQTTGHEVVIKVNKNMIPLKVAKAYASELTNLTKEYQLLQAPLGKVRIGYRPSILFEFGETYYDHIKNRPKVLCVRECDEIRLSKVAIDASRCSKYRKGISVVTHEFGHVLYSVRTPEVALSEFEKTIKEIYEKYEKEKRKALISSNYEEMAKWYLGNYADVSINEFIAEAFQEYRNCKKPTKYALKVGKVIDLYFKK